MKGIKFGPTRTTTLSCQSRVITADQLTVWDGTPKKWELTFGGQALCSTGFTLWVSVLGTHIYQCTSWHCCEMMLCSASMNSLFEASFSVFAHFTMGDLQVHLSALCWAFSSFWPKMAWPLCPTLLIHLISPQVTFLVSPDEKSFQRKMS